MADTDCSIKVYLPAIEGHVPPEMVRAIRTFLEFCYLARRDVIDTDGIRELQEALDKFHHYREIFERSGVRPDGFNLPRQHSFIHYIKLIHAFGAPNGLCSSITESKHIKAIKEPWRRSNHYEALGQMLITNQRLDKLAAARVDFASRGMLKGTLLSDVLRAQGQQHTSNYMFCINDVYSGYNELQAESPATGTPADAGAAINAGAAIDDDDDDDDGTVPGPTVMAHVDLAKKMTGKNLF